MAEENDEARERFLGGYTGVSQGQRFRREPKAKTALQGE